MEFPKPTIGVDAAFSELFISIRCVPDAIAEPRGRHLAEVLALRRLQGLLAQAWEEGRWSPPGACMNPYGAPAETVAPGPVATLPGEPLRKLQTAAGAALAWIENMAPTVRRTALADQLRAALGDR